jgi:hypothetical protein
MSKVVIGMTMGTGVRLTGENAEGFAVHCAARLKTLSSMRAIVTLSSLSGPGTVGKVEFRSSKGQRAWSRVQIG